MKLRPALMDDAEIVLEWRNDETTRNNSFSKDIISPDVHKKWYQGKLEDKSCLMLIMEDGNKKVGQLRIDRIDDIGSLSCMIAPSSRGQGYGKQMVAMCEAVLPEGINALVGFVEEQNISSKKCFINNGYSEVIAGNISCFIKLMGKTGTMTV